MSGVTMVDSCRKSSSAKLSCANGEPTTLRIGEDESPLTELLPEHAIFFEQVVDDVLLPVLDETSECEHEKLKREVHRSNATHRKLMISRRPEGVLIESSDRSG